MVKNLGTNAVRIPGRAVLDELKKLLATRYGAAAAAKLDDVVLDSKAPGLVP